MMQMLGFRGSSTASKNMSSSSQTLPRNPIPSPSSLSVGPARPLHFVYCDENGKFCMDPEAIAELQLIKGPIGVVSVCGRARQGKSFLLNQLLGRSNGFQVASTHRPCTKGLWMWSVPLKQTALDGTEYYLLFLDSEGIDAYDQTGTYSTKIFSLAVVLSSMFIYNQMGGIDEAALDRLSLVTEMTKHIRLRASGERATASELAQFSPVFVWLLRDFYLDLAEDNRKVTPRDYLELALSPMQGGGKDTSAKNEIRESIRALFPDRECFTLVRPLNKENDLQRLDQFSLDKLRPEFRSGLNALTKYVFERTRPKQVGATVMTGAVLAGITQSFLNAINNGAVPTLSSSWQSVEEAECRRAYQSATELYMFAFDRTKPPDEVILRETHEDAVQKSLAAFSASAVGVGSARRKYEKLLQFFFRKAFEDYKRNAFMEADLMCSNTIQGMERKLQAACHVPGAKFGHVVRVLSGLILKYETSSHGPGKWQKLATFLRRSLEGPIHDLVKKQFDQNRSEKSALMSKYCSREDKLGLLEKQLEACEKHKADYLRHNEEAIQDKHKMMDDYRSHVSNLQNQCNSLEERCSSLVKALDAIKLESSEWKREYQESSLRWKAEEELANAEITALRSRVNVAEATLAAAHEQAIFAQVEASDWKQKYDNAVTEAKIALERAERIREHTNEHREKREDALREEFSANMNGKDEEIKDKQAKIKDLEDCLTGLSLELKAAESKLKNNDLETSTLKLEIKELNEKLDSAKATANSHEKEAQMLKQEKIHLEQQYQSQYKRFSETKERCRTAENEVKRVTELADKARAEAACAQKEKSDIQHLVLEKAAQIDRAERHVDSLERQKPELIDEAVRLHISTSDAVLKAELLEEEVGDREKDSETLMKSNYEQRATTNQVLKGPIETEQATRVAVDCEAEASSLQLQSTQGKSHALQQEMTSIFSNETTLESKPFTREAKDPRRLLGRDLHPSLSASILSVRPVNRFSGRLAPRAGLVLGHGPRDSFSIFSKATCGGGMLYKPSPLFVNFHKESQRKAA
ncbi:uncharacterized protein LOC131245269 [Magnolia sinica]|uniref:uncharacterized protein LOC131245269 n=1 Tax=Magnolia sinica TaxID=86752 RepID=UPI00265A2DF6|nr:uncharacterized protein LOC131245269 [Magnolia sinica]